VSGRRGTGTDTGYGVIMAGGRGTRFWPLSRRRRPKQLLPLDGDVPLLRATYERIAPLLDRQRLLVVTNREQEPAVRRLLPELPSGHVVGEPVGRNTAPCAALAAGIVARLSGPDVPLALLPADHLIADPDTFRAQLADAMSLVAGGEEVVTFGIVPDRPATGYGYIETEGTGEAVRRGLRFVEKPDATTAAAYLAGGRHLWNSGMFVWRAGALLERLARHAPEVTACVAPAVAAHGTAAFAERLAEAYAECPSVSIDYAVMENLTGFAVLPARFGWSDLGSWDTWGEVAPDLGAGNRGLGRVFSLRSTGNIVHAGDRTLALIGVDDLVVVATEDAVLVCARDEVQSIKELIDMLERAGRDDLL